MQPTDKTPIALHHHYFFRRPVFFFPLWDQQKKHAKTTRTTGSSEQAQGRPPIRPAARPASPTHQPTKLTGGPGRPKTRPCGLPSILPSHARHCNAHAAAGLLVSPLRPAYRCTGQSGRSSAFGKPPTITAGSGCDLCLFLVLCFSTRTNRSVSVPWILLG